MATVVVCVACAQAVPNSRDRRRVQSESARQTLSEIVSRVYPNAVSVFLPAENPAIVCRSCFGQLEKLQKLRAEISRMNAALESGIRRYGEQAGIQSTGASLESISHSPLTPRGRKRRLYESPICRPPAKRLAMDTPSRRFMQQTVAHHSPAVAVSSQVH